MSISKSRLYRLIHLFWVFPAYLVFLSFHQGGVYYGMKSTLNDGELITAQVIDAKIKRIASQSNGWVVLSFSSKESDQKVEQKLGLPVNIASKLMMDPELLISYLPSSFVPIVIRKTASVHLNVVKINLAIACISSFILCIVMFYASRFAERKYRAAGMDEPQIVRID